MTSLGDIRNYNPWGSSTSLKDLQERACDGAWTCIACKNAFSKENSSIMVCDYCESFVCAKSVKLNATEYKMLDMRGLHTKIESFL